MPKIVTLHIMLIDLNKKVAGFQDIFKGYMGAIAQISQNIQESLDVLLRNAQFISGMSYQKDFSRESLEQVSGDMLKEMTKLALLKEELQALSQSTIADIKG